MKRPISMRSFLFLIPAFIVILTFFFIPVYTIISGFLSTINVFTLVGIPPINLSLSFSVMYIDFYSFFLVTFISLSIATILVSLKSSREKVEFKKRYIFYLGYMFLYPILFSIFWISTVFYEILGVERKW